MIQLRLTKAQADALEQSRHDLMQLKALFDAKQQECDKWARVIQLDGGVNPDEVASYDLAVAGELTFMVCTPKPKRPAKKNRK
jgi:hypothetical protein